MTNEKPQGISHRGLAVKYNVLGTFGSISALVAKAEA